MNFIAQRILDQRQASLRPPLGVVPPGAVSLALGEPDFAPPQAVIDATTQAVAQGRTNYTDQHGIAELRDALLTALPARPSDWDKDNIVVTHGATAGLGALLFALIEPGDKVVIPQPAYSLYADQVVLAGGKQAADALAQAIGEEGEILVLQGIAGSSASRHRGQGFEEGIAAYPNIEVVAKQTANFDRTEGLNVTTNLLQANPNIKAIFAENDEMALGAIEALGARAGEEVKVFGFDGTADGLTAVEDGKLEGTIAQQPDELGARAVEQAAAIFEGGTAEEEVPVEVVTVTNENVAEFK